jgi:hypothetical protein
MLEALGETPFPSDLARSRAVGVPFPVVGRNWLQTWTAGSCPFGAPFVRPLPLTWPSGSIGPYGPITTGPYCVSTSDCVRVAFCLQGVGGVAAGGLNLSGTIPDPVAGFDHMLSPIGLAASCTKPFSSSSRMLLSAASLSAVSPANSSERSRSAQYVSVLSSDDVAWLLRLSVILALRSAAPAGALTQPAALCSSVRR